MPTAVLTTLQIVRRFGNKRVLRGQGEKSRVPKKSRFFNRILCVSYFQDHA